MSGTMMIVAIVLIVFASVFGSELLKHIGDIVKDRQQHKLEELKIKTQMENQILGGSSVIAENMTAELKALREEVQQLRSEVNQLSSKVDVDYVRQQQL